MDKLEFYKLLCKCDLSVFLKTKLIFPSHEAIFNDQEEVY